MRTEIACAPKAEKLVWLLSAVLIQTVKTWPTDHLGLKYVQLEMSENLPQGYLACGSQACIATLLVDPSMSALPIIETQQSQRVGLLSRQWGTWVGFRPWWDRLVLLHWQSWFCDSNRSKYERNTLFRYLVNAASWKTSVANLTSAGLWLNASKSKSLLTKQCFLASDKSLRSFL